MKTEITQPHNTGEMRKHVFISTVDTTVHTNPSRKQSFLKTPFKGEEFIINASFLIVWAMTPSKGEEFINASFLIVWTKIFWNWSFAKTIMWAPFKGEEFINASFLIVWTKIFWNWSFAKTIMWAPFKGEEFMNASFLIVCTKIFWKWSFAKTILRFPLLIFPQTQIQNNQWLLRF